VQEKKQDTDLQALIHDLRRHLNDRLPESWKKFEDDGQRKLYTFPVNGKDWEVVGEAEREEKDRIQLEVKVALPVNDPDDNSPWIGLYVPSAWKKHDSFVDKLVKPQGFVDRLG
jgi:hypothetical protein